MNSETKLIKSRIGLLKLAEHLKNVTKACKFMGTSRDSFYRIKQLYETGGEEALVGVSHQPKFDYDLANFISSLKSPASAFFNACK